MAFSSGVFTRNNGVNTGTQVWQDDRDASTKIDAGRHDTHDQDIATALSTCLLKDGSQTVTANIPFAGFRLTNIGDATANTDAPSTKQVQDGSLVVVTAGGSSNAYTGTFTPSITPVQGTRIIMVANHTNTGAATWNGTAIQTLASKALVAGQIQNGDYYELIYTGSVWLITNPYEGWIDFSGSVTFGAATGTWSPTCAYYDYKIDKFGLTCTISLFTGDATPSSSTSYLSATLPIASSSNGSNRKNPGVIKDDGTFEIGQMSVQNNSSSMLIQRGAGGNFGNSSSARLEGMLFYEVA